MCGLDCRPLPVLALALLLRGQQSEASVFPEDCLNMEGGKIQATYLGQALACPTCQAPFFKGCLSAAPTPSVSLRPGHCPVEASLLVLTMGQRPHPLPATPLPSPKVSLAHALPPTSSRGHLQWGWTWAPPHLVGLGPSEGRLSDATCPWPVG